MMFAKEFQSGITLSDLRELKPSNLPDISITDVRIQKGPFPSLLCAFDRSGRGSTRRRARFKMPKPPQQTSFLSSAREPAARRQEAFC
jgi:hypothetical protein